MSKFLRYCLAAVVDVALLSACVPVPPTTTPPPTPDQIAQVDLIKALNAEQSVHTSTGHYDASIATMMAIDPSLDWGARLVTVVGDAVSAGDHGVVCLNEQSTSGTTFSIGRVAAGAVAGTYYGKVACPATPSPFNIAALGTSW